MSKLLCILENQEIRQDEDGCVYYFAAARIDADGGYRAYHPDNIGLDDLRNAGHKGNWFGIVTDEHGEPYIQGPADPYPGYYVSSTAYENRDYAKKNPKRYLDSESVPYVVISPLIRNATKGVVLGCKAEITYKGKSANCIVGDIGPTHKIGEISIAAAKAVGIDSDARRGGEESQTVMYRLWPDIPAEINGVKYNLIPARGAA